MRRPPSRESCCWRLLALFALQALLKFGNSYLLSRSAEQILADLRIRLYDHLQALPLGFYHQRRQGEILALLTHDVTHLSGFISGTLLSVVPLLLTVVGAVLLMFRIDARLALFVAVLVPLFYLLLKVLGRRLRPLASQLQDAHAEAIATAEENLGMLPAIKTFTREAQESERYRQKIHRILHLSAEQRRIYAALGPILQFLAAAGMVFVLWMMSGQMAERSPAEMVSFLLYAALLTRPVSALADVYGQTRQAGGALQRLKQVLTEASRAARPGMATPCRTCAARSNSATSSSPIPAANRCSTASICTSAPAKPSPSPARTAPARAPWSTC
jgi:ATP-binding cassette, subfamily B, bacterial